MCWGWFACTFKNQSCAFLSNSVFIKRSWNWPSWEYLHLRNQKMLYIRNSRPLESRAEVKHCQLTTGPCPALGHNGGVPGELAPLAWGREKRQPSHTTTELRILAINLVMAALESSFQLTMRTVPPHGCLERPWALPIPIVGTGVTTSFEMDQRDPLPWNLKWEFWNFLFKMKEWAKYLFLLPPEMPKRIYRNKSTTMKRIISR